MNPNEARVALNTGLAILGLVALRLIAAAFTPITFDEAYYWMWSKHLAGGYYDHPPMVAVVIRLGTLIAGDTEFGVRLVSILLALPMSWAIYQAGAILFGSRRVAASSAILLNITLMAAVGTMIVTPVRSSPASIARSTGAAPRQRGSSDGCTFKSSWLDRSGSLISAPNAHTTTVR